MNSYTTGIDDINDSEDLNDPNDLNGQIFSLDGRKLSGVPSKGLYITNGKKLLKQ